MRVEGTELPLAGLQVMPGLVNAHDHLEFALFPRLGPGPHPNLRSWADAAYKPHESPVREHLSIPKEARLLWGGLRNLLSGVTTVSHHNPYHPVFDDDFPVRVVKHFSWAHSLTFSADVAARARGSGPFLIHLGEGTDEESAAEIFRLDEIGALTSRTVLIHAVGLNDDGWTLATEKGASVVWCPQSNLFTLGRTLALSEIPQGVTVALGTDSPLTSQGDLLDELRAASHLAGCACEDLCPLVTDNACKILQIEPDPGDWIATTRFGDPPKLVVIADRIALVSPDLLKQLPPVLRSEFSPLELCGRSLVFVRWNVRELVDIARQYLGSLPLTLGGREVMA